MTRRNFQLADVFSVPRSERSIINYALTDTSLVPCVEEAIRQCELTGFTSVEQIITAMLYTYFVHVNTLEEWELSVYANNECWETDWLDAGCTGVDMAILDVKFGTLAKYIVGFYDTVVSAFAPIVYELKRPTTSFVGVERVINNKIIVFIEYHGY